MDFNWGEILTVAAASGAVAGFVNQGLGAARDKRGRIHESDEHQKERQHQLDLQSDEREHKATLRAEEQHSSARATYLPEAQRVYEWLEFTSLDIHGLDQSMVTMNLSKPELSSPARVVAALRDISTGHPTQSVRLAADDILSDIQNHYVELQHIDGGYDIADPDVDTFIEWRDKTGRLIELMHDAPT